MKLPDMSPEQIENMIKLLQAMLPVSENKTEKANKDKQDKEEDEDIHYNSPIKTKETKVKKIKKENLFNKMIEKNMHKQDITIDKKLNIKPPVPRNREFNMAQVVCRVCGKQENIAASLIQDRSRYKCNRCSSSPG